MANPWENDPIVSQPQGQPLAPWENDPITAQAAPQQAVKPSTGNAYLDVMTRQGTPLGALRDYAGRVGDQFMSGFTQLGQGAHDTVDRPLGSLAEGNAATGIPRMALGALGAAFSPVSALVSPIADPVVRPIAGAIDRNISKPIETATGYPSDITTQAIMAAAPLGAGKIMKGIRSTAGDAGTAQAVSDFAKIGQTPTLAQATSGSNSALQYLGRLLEFTPGGYLPYRGRIKAQLEASAKTINDAVARVGDVSQQEAGIALKEGASRFANKISKTAGRLEAKLEEAVPGKSIIAPSNTLGALDELTASGDNSAVGASTISPSLRAAKDSFQADVKALGGVTFESLKRFRTQLGAKTNSGDSLMKDVSAGEASHLYKALTKDMEEAASAAGQDGLVKTRNSYYAKRKTEMENIFEKRIKTDQASEQIFRSFRDSDFSHSERIMRQLSPKERRVVAGQVLKEIGSPTAGEAAGDTASFSLDRFDTNMAKFSGTASKGGNRLENFFNMSGTQDLLAALKTVSAVAERYKGAEKFLKNPSQSAIVGAQLATLGGIGATALLDPVLALQYAGISYGIPYALTRTGNSAAFIRLIAAIGKQNKATLPAHIARMSAFVSQNPQYAPALKEMLDKAYQPPQQDQSKAQ